MSRMQHKQAAVPGPCPRSFAGVGWEWLVVVVLGVAGLYGQVPASGAGCLASPAGLVGWWPGDVDGRNLAGTNWGILQPGAKVGGDGVVDGAFHFDGTNGFVSIPDAPELRPTNLTVEAWVCFAGLDSPGSAPAEGRQFIVRKPNAYLAFQAAYDLSKIRLADRDVFSFQVNSPAGAVAEARGSTSIVPEQWYHVVGVRGPNSVQIYVNGQLEGQTAVDFPQSYVAAPLYLGSPGPYWYNRKFKGWLDEVSLYNRALSAGEIASLYTATEGKCRPAVIATPPQWRDAWVGDNVSLHVEAMGSTPLAYQWLFQGWPLSGATNATLLLTNVQMPVAGAYQVTVSNFLGQTTSWPPAWLSVSMTGQAAPFILQPPGNQTVFVGDTAWFNVVAGGGLPRSYQWRKNGLSLPNQTNVVLVLPQVTTKAGGYYDVVITDTAARVTNTAAALLVVVPSLDLQPPFIRGTSPDQVAGWDQEVELGVEAAGTEPLNFQWRKDGVPLPEATEATLYFPAVTPADAGRYDVVITGPGGSVTSRMITLTVKLIVDPELEKAVACALDVPPTGITQAALTEFERLTLRHRGIQSLRGLEWATNLTELDLSGNAVTNLEPLRAQSRLTRLHLDQAQFVQLDLTPLAALHNLTNLVLGRVLADTYEPLAALTNLTDLTIREGGRIALGFLEVLPRLQALRVLQSWAEDLAPVATLTNLQQLELRWMLNHMDERQWVAASAPLRRLNLEGNGLTNFGWLSDFPRLESLNLADNELRDLSALAGLTNLTYLTLSRNPLTDYAALSGAPRLVNLELSGNHLSNLGFLAALPGLKFLDLSYNAITNLDPLLGLTNLESLVLAGNPAANFPLLTNMPRLTSLWLHDCGLGNANFIAGLPGLRHLNLDGNQIVDVTPVLGLTNLTGLGFSHNPADNPLAVAALTRLTGLRLEQDQLGDISPLTNLQQLTYLSLNQNQIADAAPLGRLTQLQSHYLAHNRIRDLSYLLQLPHLRAADLSFNLLNPVEAVPEQEIVDIFQCQNGDEPAGGGRAADGRVFHRDSQLTWTPQHTFPSISAPTRWFLAQDSEDSLAFTVDYSGQSTPVTVGVISGDPILLPPPQISLAGAEFVRHVTLRPGLNQTGVATLTLVATNEAGLTSQAEIRVEVLVPAPLGALDPDWERALRWGAGNGARELTSADLLNVTRLIGSDVNLTGFQGWPWLTNVSRLYLTGKNVHELGFLSYLPNLQSLTLMDTAVVDFSPLTNATGLTDLYLSRAAISNLSFFARCSQLTSLTLHWLKVSDLTPLAGLTNLTQLEVNFTTATNLLPLYNLPALRETDVRFNLLDLAWGSVNSRLVDYLEARGVDVWAGPQRAPPKVSMPNPWYIWADAPARLPVEFLENGMFIPDDFIGTVQTLQPGLLPQSALKLESNEWGYDWELEVTPATGQSGAGQLLFTVTNDVGLGSSQLVTVMVSAARPISAPAYGLTDLDWQSSPGAGWLGQNAVFFQTFPAMQSAPLEDDGVSELEAELIGPGTLNFWWKVSSEEEADWLVFESATQTNAISGEVDWQEESVHLGPRRQVVRWRYGKDGSGRSGNDAGWLAHVTFVPDTWLDIFPVPEPGHLQMDLYGVSNQWYELQASTDLMNWRELTLVQATNRITSMKLDAQGHPAQFYRARAVVEFPYLWVSARTPAGFQLSWSGMGILQGAPTVDGPWEGVAGRSPAFISTAAASSRFFRVQVTGF